MALQSHSKMLNRRQFVGTSALAGLVLRSGAQAPAKVRQVDIVHHTHTDVGYTELPAVIRDLQVRYLDAAIDACQADSRFRWTIESLVELDDWWRGSPRTRQERLVAMIGRGQMDAMALPFNQTQCLNALQWRQMMSWISPELWKRLRIRVAMQNDVNGFPRAGAMALLDHNIHHLLMGINADSGGPPFRRPSAFWWKMPDGRRLFVWLGEHYGTAMRYVEPARKGPVLETGEQPLRAAHKTLTEHLRSIEGEGYDYDRLILTFTHPDNYDNGGPFPSLGPFVEAWNRLGLEPRLRLALATDAVLEMEKAAGSRAPELEGEWTDWWANGDASGPREVAASRYAKRYVAAANSPVWGSMPVVAGPAMESILKDLCLFDEHTWGAAGSVSAPYSLRTLAQYVEKSDLAYKPMGMAEKLLLRRMRAKIDPLPAGLYAINPWPAEMSGWASITGGTPAREARTVVDSATGAKVDLLRDGGAARFWLEKLPPNTVRSYRVETEPIAAAPRKAPEVKLDGDGWPQSAAWPGMRKPLFEGSLGEFLSVGVIPPADRRTITQLHANPNAAEREAIRAKSFRQTGASYGPALLRETPHTLVYSQEIRHERLAQSRRSVELWRNEARARVSVRLDRLSSLSPEVLFLAFSLPVGVPLPRFSNGGVPLTPYRDQLKGSCRDYFAIDGWAHYHTGDGDWLWVTRDAPLVAIGGPHVVERHQEEPAGVHRILAMVFDNCWHTNFVADSHGAMEFQFDLTWKEAIDSPTDTAEALAGEPIAFLNPAVKDSPAVIDRVFRQ